MERKRFDLEAELIENCWFGNLIIVTYLLDKGADVNTADEMGNTPLIIASIKGHLDVVKLLLVYDADLDAVNTAGHDAVMVCHHYGNTEGFNYLYKFQRMRLKLMTHDLIDLRSEVDTLRIEAFEREMQSEKGESFEDSESKKEMSESVIILSESFEGWEYE